MGKAIDRSRQIVDQMVKGVEFLLNKNKVTVDHRRGVVRDRRSGCASPGIDEPIDATNVIIATGARPRALPGLETDGDDHHQQHATRWRCANSRRSVVIVGGGPIGVEFATFWRAYGVEVTIVEMLDHLLPLEDEEISIQLERAFKKRGIKFLTGAQDATADGARTAARPSPARSKGKEQTARRRQGAHRHRLRGERRGARARQDRRRRSSAAT